MSDDFNELKKAIVEKNFPQAYHILDTMMLENAEFDNYGKVQMVIIKSAIELKSLEGLSLLKHPFCHGDWYQNDHFLASQRKLAHMLVKEKAFDLIEPCVLKSLTHMDAVTSHLIKSQNNEGIDYILNHPRLELDYAELKNQYINLFHKAESIPTLLKLKDKLYHTPMIINECVDKSIKSKNVKAIDYLFENFSTPTHQVFSALLDYIQTGKKQFDFGLRSILELSFDNDQVLLEGIKPMPTHEYICEFYTKFQKHMKFEADNKITQYFLELYIGKSHEIAHEPEDRFKAIYEFLDIVYANTSAPSEIVQAPQKKCNSMLNGKNIFADFEVYYEKRKLEASINQVSQSGSKLKI